MSSSVKTLFAHGERRPGSKSSEAASSDQAPASRTREREIGGRSSPQSLTGVSVLVVEDEPDAREVVGALLEARGAQVELSASVAEAFQRLARHRPDVIVSDIGMPGVDGFELARGLRALAPERGGDTPIVALTAYTSAQDRRRSLEAGYDFHLAKPVNTDELVRVLARLSKHGSQAS